jgi:hypothetical protein
MQAKKIISVSMLAVILLIIGFIMLLRSCLAKYDERYALSPGLFFEKAGKKVYVTLIYNFKTTSYSSSGGFTRRSGTTRYYIQSNDAATTRQIAKEFIIKGSRIKQHPVEMLQVGGPYAWAFVNELMAFDPFTLETVATKDRLIQKNPQLAGKLPEEKRYYEAPGDGTLFITANDGTKWLLDATTLVARLLPMGEKPVAFTPAAGVKQAIERVAAQRDSVYQLRNDYKGQQELYQQYRSGKISMAQYQQGMKTLDERRRQLQENYDSFYSQRMTLEALLRRLEHNEGRINDLNRGNLSFSQTKTHADTLNGKWYGLFALEEKNKIEEKELDNQGRLYNETARRYFYNAEARVTTERNNTWLRKFNLRQSAETFLDGGFLLSKYTGLPQHTPGGYLVVHKTKIGNDGQIIISNVGFDGVTKWTYATPFTSWTYWQEAGQYLLVTGNNRKGGNSNEASLLISINLQNGQASQYDYRSGR